MSILDTIIAQKKVEISGLFKTLKNAQPKLSKRDFLKALKRKPGQKNPNFIMEIKKASPSKGAIAPEANVVEVAEAYEDNGAAAISVLTDYEFFDGSLADLNTVAREVMIPVLRKDFVIDELQILEARLSEADAVLLMTSVLKTSEKLQSLREYAERLGMDALVETQSEAEIQIAIESGAKIIGVNARHFSDLSVDINRLPDLLKMIPPEIVRVAESGMVDRESIFVVNPCCDAVLVGSVLMSQSPTSIPQTIAQLKNEA